MTDYELIQEIVFRNLLPEVVKQMSDKLLKDTLIARGQEPSLPSNLDEAVERIASDIAPTYPDISWDTCYEKIKEGIKAGVVWMAGQGVKIGETKIYLEDMEPYHNTDVFIEDVEGIPITPEILEKNGFRVVGDVFVFGEVDDALVRLTPTINNAYRIEIQVADLMTSYRGYCSYVHQLQQALKLCRIDKEIEL